MKRITMSFGNLLRMAGTIAVLGLAPGIVTAQGAFAPAARVNDGVITNFEVDQRARLMGALRQPGANMAGALDLLIDDRLKVDAARLAGIEPGFDEVQAGIDDFAARANLTGAEFVEALGGIGVAPETIEDYVRSTLSWGELVRTRFARQARPSEAEIDRAMALGTGTGSARVLLSEIILPLTPDLAQLTEERASAISEITTTAAFEDAARRFSVAPSRVNGGRLDWTPLSELPGQLAPIFLTMSPGEVTDPVAIEGGIVIFQFRGIQDVRPPLAGNVTLDFMRVRFAPGTDLVTERQRLASRVDRCDDLYGVYFGASEDRLIRQTAQRSAIPGSINAVLNTLDPGEVGILGPQSAADGGSLVMLCSRTEIREQELTRDQVAQSLFVRRLNSYADGYLAELRADAFIEEY